uniref:ARID domain-containing protein n=1 Tax=Trichuris muris TaxID=70415 RepID=A0A5S6QB94_TRIMR
MLTSPSSWPFLCPPVPLLPWSAAALSASTTSLSPNRASSLLCIFPSTTAANLRQANNTMMPVGHRTQVTSAAANEELVVNGSPLSAGEQTDQMDSLNCPTVGDLPEGSSQTVDKSSPSSPNGANGPTANDASEEGRLICQPPPPPPPQQVCSDMRSAETNGPPPVDIASSMMGNLPYMSACQTLMLARAGLQGDLLGLNVLCQPTAPLGSLNGLSPSDEDINNAGSSAVPLDLTRPSTLPTSSSSSLQDEAPKSPGRTAATASAVEEEEEECRRRRLSAERTVAQPQTSWSFEEQFKQLYELSDDTKRKEFLDDLFNFMQRRGTPVTRIPIMAKQVLDLYELYRLVVSHGGLVEVINKKLWREITKGLHLPQSITSAAFTLRTQYMKYLYAYECDREKLSSPPELKAAIDGNKREGRRSSFNPFSQVSPTLLGRHLNGSLYSDEEPLSSSTTQCTLGAHGSTLASVFREQALAFEASRQNLNRSPRLFPESSRYAGSGRASTNSTDSDCSVNVPFSTQSNRPAVESGIGTSINGQEHLLNNRVMPTAHIRVFNRTVTSEGHLAVENSLVVSMEINGTMYQGVLFAQPASVRHPAVGGH